MKKKSGGVPGREDRRSLPLLFILAHLASHMLAFPWLLASLGLAHGHEFGVAESYRKH